MNYFSTSFGINLIYIFYKDYVLPRIRPVILLTVARKFCSEEKITKLSVERYDVNL